MNNCFYENQFRFRKRHSTNHALVTITEKIRHTLDNHHYMCGVFLDFQKAFDDILTSKLHFYGIRDTSFKLIKSYLTNRKQYTYINDSESTALISTHGVTQGSDLLYSSYFLKQINRYVKHDLKLIVHWFRANRISLNVNKTNCNFSTEKQANDKKYELSNERPKDNTQNSNQISSPSIR